MPSRPRRWPGCSRPAPAAPTYSAGKPFAARRAGVRRLRRRAGNGGEEPRRAAAGCFIWLERGAAPALRRPLAGEQRPPSSRPRSWPPISTRRASRSARCRCLPATKRWTTGASRSSWRWCRTTARSTTSTSAIVRERWSRRARPACCCGGTSSRISPRWANSIPAAMRPATTCWATAPSSSTSRP